MDASNPQVAELLAKLHGTPESAYVPLPPSEEARMRNGGRHEEPFFFMVTPEHVLGAKAADPNNCTLARAGGLSDLRVEEVAGATPAEAAHIHAWWTGTRDDGRDCIFQAVVGPHELARGLVLFNDKGMADEAAAWIASQGGAVQLTMSNVTSRPRRGTEDSPAHIRENKKIAGRSLGAWRRKASKQAGKDYEGGPVVINGAVPTEPPPPKLPPNLPPEDIIEITEVWNAGYRSGTEGAAHKKAGTRKPGTTPRRIPKEPMDNPEPSVKTPIDRNASRQSKRKRAGRIAV